MPGQRRATVAFTAGSPAAITIELELGWRARGARFRPPPGGSGHLSGAQLRTVAGLAPRLGSPAAPHLPGLDPEPIPRGGHLPTADSVAGAEWLRFVEALSGSLPRDPRTGAPSSLARPGITYVKGDLFACPKTDSLAHCISEDCRMGAGIAVLFKKKFGGVQELLNQQKKSGEVAVLKRDGRYIYYLITKKRASHKPTYENLQKSLEAMKSHCLRNGVTDLSMPRIGCGLDRLQWENVSAIIEEVFEATDIKITVYTL
uniref:ADP-ribose glycohydrolase OARD1 n=2 Tax=Leporidae TaxID=9979 RepID=A0A5F9CDT7_RABIT